MPFDSETLPLDKAALVPGQVRIAWRIGGATGHGAWFHADDRPMLEDWCRDLNDRYGNGTHWIQTCGAYETA